MKLKTVRGFLAVLILATAGALPTQALAVPSEALYLAMDGSGSINGAEFTGQVNAYVGALNGVFAANPGLFGQVAIGGGIFGEDFIEFFAPQAIDDAGDLAALVAAIAALDPARAGVNQNSTAIGDAITAAANSLQNYETGLGIDIDLLIDVTTDGANNFGPAPGPVAAGLTPSPINSINCLGIGVGADCTWVGAAGTNFGSVSVPDLQEALEVKLVTEFSVPEPSVLALLGIGLVGMGFAGRRSHA